MRQNTLIVILSVSALALGALIVGIRTTSDRQIESHIKNFVDCSEAGFPILETYPKQCTSPDGRVFTRLVEPPQTSTSTFSAHITATTSTTTANILHPGSENSIHGSSSPLKATTTQPLCRPTGCNGEICSDAHDIVSTCTYNPVFECYKNSDVKCERQINGMCGWTETAALEACINAGGPAVQ
jgi:hypothetical protein